MAYPERKPDSPLAERFVRMLELLGINRAEFSVRPHVTQQHINTWLRRQKIGEAGIARLRELAESRGLHGFSENWINFGEGEEPSFSPSAADLLALGPNRAEVTTGDRPNVAVSYVRFEYLLGYSKELAKSIDIPHVLVGTIGELLRPSVRVMINPGDAMSGVIERGELVFVDSSINQVDADGIYAYKLAGVPQVRRFHIRGMGILRLTGTHAYEDSLELSGAELKGLEIGGRVVGKWGYTKI